MMSLTNETGQFNSVTSQRMLSHVFYMWPNSPQWVMASSFTRFLDLTQRRTTVGRTPLDE
jgi:hypothetical protein